MNYIHRHISPLTGLFGQVAVTTVALAMAVTSVSCTSADEPDAPGNRGEFSFGLTLSVGDNESFMRSAPADGDYDPGAGYENYIDLAGSDYRIYLFNANNRLIHAVSPSDVSLSPSGNSMQGSKTYDLRFSLTDIEQFKPYGIDNTDSCTFKMLMLANWRNYPAEISLIRGVTTIDDLMKSSEALRGYNAPGQPYLTADDRIPMFGVNLYRKVKLNDNSLTMIDKLHLLRAYSKIEVYESETSAAALTKVALTKYSTKSYNAPVLKDYLQGEYVTNSYRNDYGAMTFRPVTTAEDGDSLALRQDPATGHFFIYVPEFTNLSGNKPRPDAERARLLITYADGRTDHIEFKYYDEVNASRNGAKKGDYFDIRRNYWYRYEINKGSVVLSMRVDVIPYVEVELNPGFGFDDPIINIPDEWVTPPWVEITPDD